MTWSKWKNHILKGRPEKERKWLKYGIREARLQLISRWAKRCSRHYQRTKPHKQKRQRIVISKSSYNLSLLSWKAHQSSHTHCIMKYLWKCHLDQVIVSYVVPRRSYAVGVWYGSTGNFSCMPNFEARLFPANAPDSKWNIDNLPQSHKWWKIFTKTLFWCFPKQFGMNFFSSDPYVKSLFYQINIGKYDTFVSIAYTVKHEFVYFRRTVFDLWKILCHFLGEKFITLGLG